MWFDIKWRRRSDGGINEAQGLTAEQAMFRLKGAIPAGGSVEVIAIGLAKGPAKYDSPSNERFGDGTGTMAYEVSEKLGGDSGTGGA